jgi:hypothetical protein
VVILFILGLGFWFLARPGFRPGPDVAVTRNKAVAGTTNKADVELSTETSRNVVPRRPATASAAQRGFGAGMAMEAPLFAGRDIHEVPLGEVVDQARRIPFDETRGHETRLGTNERGRLVTVKIWPAAGASSMEAMTLRQGRIVARIESDGSFEKLGLADGLNYLWVEGRPDGGYRGVVIPATAFSPLFDLGRVAITERTPAGVPLEKGA